MRRLAGVLLACCLLAAACEDPPEDPVTMPDGATGRQRVSLNGESSAVPAPTETVDDGILQLHWYLAGMSLDGRLLRITTPYNLCAAEEPTLELSEAEDSVTVVVSQVIVPHRPSEEPTCSGPGHLLAETVRLAEPLGRRELAGCAEDDCSALDRRERTADAGPLGSVGGAAITGDAVVVLARGELVGLSAADGGVRWRKPQSVPGGPSYNNVFAVGDHLLAPNSNNHVRELDPHTGEHVWSSDTLMPCGFGREAPAATGGAALLCREERIVLVEAASGAVLWEQAAEGRVDWARVDGEQILTLATVEAPDPLPPNMTRAAAAQTVLTAYTVSDGTPRWSARTPGGPFGLAVHEGVVTVRVFGGAYGFDTADGSIRWHLGPFELFDDPGLDLGAHELLGPHDLAPQALNVVTGAVTDWPGPPLTDHQVRNAVAVDGVILRTESDGRLLAVEADGTPRWATFVGTARTGLSVGSGLIVLRTPLGAIALDLDTGDVVWEWIDDSLNPPRP